MTRGLAGLVGTVSLAALTSASSIMGCGGEDCDRTGTCLGAGTGTGNGDGGDGSVNGIDGAPQAPFSFEPPTQLQITHDTSSKATLTLKRASGPAGDVVVTVPNLPPGVTVDPLTIPAAESTGELVVHVSPTAKQGPFDAAIEGASGKEKASTTLPVFVRGKPGTVDTTFGIDGSILAMQQAGSPIALFAGSKDEIFVVASCDSNGAACAVRLTPTGGSDAAYGGGLAKISMVDATTAALGSDGKLTIGGGNTPPVVARLTAEGTLDPTLGTGAGSVTVAGGSPGGTAYQMWALALGAGNSFLVAFDTADGYIGFRKFDAGGGSSGWGPGGSGYQAFRWNNFSFISGMSVRANGALVFAGMWDGGGSKGVGIAQWAPGGLLDTSFATNGSQTHVTPSRPTAEQTFAVLPDGRVMAGYSGSIASFSADGKTLDAGWGTGGIAGILHTGGKMALQPDGKVVVSDPTQPGVIGRYLPSAAVDTTFGNGGKVELAVGGTTSHLALQSDGRILVLCQKQATLHVARVWN